MCFIRQPAYLATVSLSFSERKQKKKRGGREKKSWEKGESEKGYSYCERWKKVETGTGRDKNGKKGRREERVVEKQ